VPVFFIMVGVDFDLRTLFASTESMWLLPLLLGAAVLVKLGPALVFRLAFSWREALAAGVLLSARLSLIIAAAAIGRELGVISAPVNAAIIMVAILTVTAAPPLFAFLMPGRDPSVPRPIVVVGAGELGLLVARNLLAHLERVVVVDRDPALVARAQQQGLDAIAADAEAHDSHLAVCLDDAQALVCTEEDTERNFRICQYVRGTYRLENIVAQVTATSELARFGRLGVTTMNAALDRASLLVMLVRNPAAYALLTRTDDDKEVYEHRVTSSELIGKAIGELTLPGDLLVVALRRGRELLVPHRSTRLEAGDHLTLVGSIDAIQEMRGRPVSPVPRLR
jgi:monovalent cation:H+ antiporter-2, CPA2 family